MNAKLSIGGRAIEERTLWMVIALVAVFTPVPWIAATPWILLAGMTSPIVPIAVVGGLLAVLVWRARIIGSPNRARLWGATTWWVAYGPLVLVWYVVIGSIPVDGPLFVVVAAVAIVGVFGIAAGLAVALFEVCRQLLAKSLDDAGSPVPSNASM